jgi:hypothetical protein
MLFGSGRADIAAVVVGRSGTPGVAPRVFAVGGIDYDTKAFRCHVIYRPVVAPTVENMKTV